MNIDQAWQSVLGQLQMEMPRALFDTWVRDTRALSLEDNMLTISVHNAYTRDWLENRLASTMERLLVGILNMGDVRVSFVVNEEQDDDSLDDAEPASEQETRDDKKKPERDETMEVALVDYDSVYEQIVHPNRAVYLPGYFRRWLRHLGSDLAWLYVAFRQTAYAAGLRTGHAANRIPGEKIARLSGITERTYWNRVENKNTWEKLKGLVEISDHGPQWDGRSSTPKRLPRRYTISMTLPLTPVDANSLSRWLAAHIEQYGGPEGVLRAAAEAPLDELIPVDALEPGAPSTVTKLVRELFGGGGLSDKLLESLASAIQNRIMPQNDLIVVTLYFLEHILPHLGAGPAWMLTLLRDMCYTDPESRQSRNRMTVMGGYDEIASWIGLSGTRRARTIWDWLNERYGPNHKEAGKYTYPISRIYINEVLKEEKQLDFGSQPRIFEALIEEIPRELLEIALTNPNDATFSIAMTRFAEANDATFSIGVTRFSYPDDAIFSIAMTRFSDSVDATFRVLSSLTLKTNSLNLNTTTSQGTEQSAAAAETGAVNLPSAWVLDRLLTQNRVHPKTQKTVRGGSAQALVSWLLYALSPEGHGISKPMNYALARLAEDPRSGAGDKYDALANVPPAALIDVTSRASRGSMTYSILTGESEDDLTQLWVDVLGTKKEPALTLLRLLVGDKAPNKLTKIAESDRWQQTENGWTRVIEKSVEEV